MATRREANAAALPGSAPRRRPVEEAGGRAPAQLRVLTATDLAERIARRRARVVKLAAAAVLAAALLALAGARALVDSEQVRLDALQQQVAVAVSQNQALQLAHAELSSPTRILQLAETRLGMVVPGSVTYLSAVNPAPSAGRRPPAVSTHPAAGSAHPAAGSSSRRPSGRRPAGRPSTLSTRRGATGR